MSCGQDYAVHSACRGFGGTKLLKTNAFALPIAGSETIFKIRPASIECNYLYNNEIRTFLEAAPLSRNRLSQSEDCSKDARRVCNSIKSRIGEDDPSANCLITQSQSLLDGPGQCVQDVCAVLAGGHDCDGQLNAVVIDELIEMNG